ncbi:helix-turn-helix transcriptional regulator [Streptomyces sp. NPDC004069]
MTHASLGFLGVEPTDEEIYRLLLRRGELDRTELAAHPAVGDRLLEDLCGRLVDLGLAREAAGGFLHPVSPAKAVESLVQAEADRMRYKMESCVAENDVVASLTAEQGTQVTDQLMAPGEKVRHIEGLEAVRAVIDELTFFTWTESLTTNPNGAISEEGIAHARPIDERVLRRGVHMRTLLGAAALDDPKTLRYAHELVVKGAEIRISHSPLERLIICDRSAALTPIDPTRTARGAVLTREPGLVSALVSLFERMWTAAQELPPPDGAKPLEEQVLGGLERQILQCLYRADKDEVGARDLGIAVRTYRKHVASLMRRLNAANRFQAALLARERGWI